MLKWMMSGYCSLLLETDFENVLTKFEDISNLRNVNKEWSVEGYITSYQHDVICNSASFDAFFLKFSRHSSERVFI